MVLLDLMGGVALLLWGLHMVQSGILWAFGSELRYLLSLIVLLLSFNVAAAAPALFVIGVVAFRGSPRTRGRSPMPELGRPVLGWRRTQSHECRRRTALQQGSEA